ncbi:MAG: HAD-IA family hydrolase [Pseudomonadota bacterium]
MTARLRLILFDVDGTLVDSQNDIVASMSAAFRSVGQTPPARAAILSIVGLSLERAVEHLAPDLLPATYEKMVDVYKKTYADLRRSGGADRSSPLFPGARAVLDDLASEPMHLLGVATGKSRRGLTFLLDAHGLQDIFITQQVADHHPSKPHPSMVLTAMGEMGVSAQDTVVIGDTRFDLEMARAAGARFIGVSWGYHAPASMTGADAIVEQFDELPAAIARVWSDLT